MSSPSLADTSVTSARLSALAERVRTTASRDMRSIIAPMTETVVGEVPMAQPTDVEHAVDRAREAQRQWATQSIKHRTAVMQDVLKQVETHRSELLDLLQIETGKARNDAVEELLDILLTCEYYSERGPELLADEQRDGALPGLTTARVTYEPRGVVGVISPWNYPLSLSIIDAIPALIAGNAVVLKPDERTPYTALALSELFEQAGLPEDLITVVPGAGDVIGPTVIEQSDYVAFTGGTETGRHVARQAGDTLTDTLLELGGNNPFLVLGDADIEQAARGAVTAAFTNAGQLCLSAERFYVVEDRYEAFLDAFLAAIDRQSLGVSYAYGPDIGSLIGADQLDRVQTHINDAVAKGATVAAGGSHRPDIGPFVHEPTVLLDVDETMAVVTEETFGPVVSVIPVPDETAAVAAANDSPYGLLGSVWTANADHGERVAEHLDCGTVCVNDAFLAGWGALDAPMGGMKQSGLGYRHGPEGLRQYTHAKTITRSRAGPITNPDWLPNRWYARGMTALIRLRRRLTGLF